MSEAPASPLATAYHAAVIRHGFKTDPSQQAVVQRLEALSHSLDAAGPIARGVRAWLGTRRAVPGLYLWGGVGRGKTFLVDLFFDTLPFADKKRLHFHRFMQLIHAALKRHPGADPLPRIAGEFARTTRVLCFDEFFVSDIADAMILGGLLNALFERGVTVVATSNIAPDDLYRDGLQRARFLPAIEAIKQNMAVMHMDTGVDYRLRTLERAELYHWPLDEAAAINLGESFHLLSPADGAHDPSLVINGRELPTIRRADGVAWFSFTVLCEGLRATADYVELAREHHSLLLSGVPAMDDGDNDAARRFIALVDECYDRNVKLILTAAVSIEQLYKGKRLGAEFERTRSRLTEMQSREYLAREHRA